MACGRAPRRALFPERWCRCAELAARIGRGAEALAGLTHLHLSSRPDAWRQWYAANQYLYGPQAAGGPRYELFTMVMAAVQAGLGVGLMPRFLAQPALDQGRWPCLVPQSLTVSQGYFFGYPQRSERSEALVVRGLAPGRGGGRARVECRMCASLLPMPPS